MLGSSAVQIAAGDFDLLMMHSSTRPLLTFAVAALNQQQFIQEAVEAAFAQTYSPLEIILSDDCSEDSTFEIMQQMAAAYRGPHRVLLNRNPVRRCIGGHMNRVLEMAGGQLIIDAAGDDVSLPHRTQVIYEAWEASGRQATSIHTDYVQIDEFGRPIEALVQSAPQSQGPRVLNQKVDPVDYVRTLDPIIFGCTHGFSPVLFKIFGNLPEEVIHEDNALGFRSILAGQLTYINEALVKYRVHGRNVHSRTRDRSSDLKSLAAEEDRLRRQFRNREIMYRGFLLDLEKARTKGLLSPLALERTLDEALRGRRRFEMCGRFLESGLFSKCRILARLKKEGLSQRDFSALLRRLFPRPVFLRIRLGLSYAALFRERRRRQPNHANVLKVPAPAKGPCHR